MQAVLATTRFAWAVRRIFFVAVVVSCGSAPTAGTTSTPTPVETVTATSSASLVDTVTPTPATAPIDANTSTLVAAPTDSSASIAAVYKCFTDHGLEGPDPALLPGNPSISLERYPTGVAVAAWDACKEGYFSIFRQVMINSAGAGAELPVDAEPLGFADCMAAFGWITLFGASAETTDLASYTADNAECRRPVDGSSAVASYCRLIHAIFDTASRDRSVSITGIPSAGTDDVRRDAAVRLYDELLEVAPVEVVDDLRTLQTAFQGAQFSEAAWARINNYQAGVCGLSVLWGSLD